MPLAAVPSTTPPPARPEPAGPALLAGTEVSKTDSARDWMGRERLTHALKATSVAVRAGETVGIVGESGSGKSTFACCLIRLIDPSGGKIHWADAEVATLAESKLRPLRHRVQVVFQDPNRSLNPRMRIGESLIEGAINFGAQRAQAEQRAAELMDKVRLPT